MRLQLADTFGAVAVSRARAAMLRESIEETLNGGEDVLIDLRGVTTLSPAVVDELFAKTNASSAGGRLSFANVPTSIEPLIRFVRAGRPDKPVAA